MVKKKKKKSKLFQPQIKSNFLCVKTSLKSILKNYDTNFPKINELVLECNEIVIRTYQFIRLFILYKYHNKQPIPEINRENIMYFIRACGIRDKRGKKSRNTKFQTELENFYDTEFKDLIGKDKFNLKNKSYLTPYLAIQIQTAFNNNIKEHFITRIRRFMNILRPDGIDDSEFNKLKNLILLNKEVPDEWSYWATNVKTNYLPPNPEKCYGWDVKVYPDKYIYYTIKMNEVVEQKNSNLPKEKRKKLFQPISLRNTILPSYITLDTNVILSLFGEKGESNMNKKTSENKDFIWNKIFKTDKKVMKLKGYEFKTIQTDGVGVSICFQKIGKKYRENQNLGEEDDLYITDLDNEEIEKCKTKKLVAIDPNKQSMVYMMDEDGNKLRYTVSQRNKESLRKRNKNILQREKFRNDIITKETEFSKYNCKTVNYEEFKEYIRAKTKLNDELKEFYERELFRKLKWRQHIYQRKSEDRFINRIEEKFGKDILLCYGNWSNTKQMKYTMPTKGVGLRRVISKKYRTVLVDEFRTSKKCSKCHKDLCNYNKIHRLLVCYDCKCDGSESKKITFINRDINACMNILNISKSWLKSRTRPMAFCRKSDYDLEITKVKENHSPSVVFNKG